MKKVWQAVVLVALTGLAINSYADVQNIRLSGDIRIRGYYTVNTDGDAVEDQVENNDSYIAQRTRVTVEADLEDHVLVVVTMKAEGLWGVTSETDSTAGAGSANGASSDRINRLWDLGITEGYVQISEMFYSPVTLKLGRQYLHYGNGLIISSIEQEYNFDAARLVLDYYPLTLDLVYANVSENTPFGGSTTGTSPNDLHVVFANARYEMSDSILKNVEVYGGWLINSRPISTTTLVPPSAGGSSPMLLGARFELDPTDALRVWAEGAYEIGPDGFVDNESIRAYIANVGLEFSLKDVEMAPTFNASYIQASGGGSDGRGNFIPWFDYMEGYNGYLFAPVLSNIHIFNVGARVNPWENTTVALQAYYYMAVDDDSFNGSNRNIDNGSLGFTPQVASDELGWEFDAIIGYDYSKDVTFQFVYGMFVPDNSFSKDSDYSARVAHEVRAEVNARF